MSKSVRLKIEQCGEQLAICIPPQVARTTQLIAGISVQLQIPASAGNPNSAEPVMLSLERMLALYDPEACVGGGLPATPVGREIVT
ncbi:MAG: hypothetical protein ACEQSK_08840 [Sphingomonadaceae bacterium]